MDKIKKAAVSTKKFVHDHRVVIAVTVTATITTVAALALNQTAIRQHNDFLKEKGLYDEFYFTEEVAA